MSKNVGDEPQQRLTPPENAAIIAALFDVEAKEKRLMRYATASEMIRADGCNYQKSILKLR